MADHERISLPTARGADAKKPGYPRLADHINVSAVGHPAAAPDDPFAQRTVADSRYRKKSLLGSSTRTSSLFAKLSRYA